MLHRPTKDEIEEAVLETTAALLARHGVARTSVQAIADGVGYSKAGILHHFASKEAVVAATVARCSSSARMLRASVETLPLGRRRDQAVITGLAQMAVAGPGFVSLMLATVTGSSQDSEPLSSLLDSVAHELLAAFSGAGELEDTRRLLSIAGALGAVAVCVLIMTRGEQNTWGTSIDDLHAHVVSLAMGALGHH